MPKVRFEDRENSLKAERRHAITAARQLCYGKDVIARLEKANSTAEISNIMHDARKSCKAYYGN